MLGVIHSKVEQATAVGVWGRFIWKSGCYCRGALLSAATMRGESWELLARLFHGALAPRQERRGRREPAKWWLRFPLKAGIGRWDG